MRALIWLTCDRSGRLKVLHEWQEILGNLKGAERADNPDHIDLCHALTQLGTDADDREIYLRRRVWWITSNHLRTNDPKSAMSITPTVQKDQATTCILRLLKLFKHDLKHQVERGELQRQLGRFEEAMAVLKSVKPDGYS